MDKIYPGNLISLKCNIFLYDTLHKLSYFPADDEVFLVISSQLQKHNGKMYILTLYGSTHNCFSEVYAVKQYIELHSRPYNLDYVLIKEIKKL